MNASQVQCPRCNAWLLDEVLNQPGLSPCPACGVPIQIEVFPALFRRMQPGQSGEIIMVEGESSCYYHPQKRAVTPCQGCGRFLCALCDCELHGQHFCPACLETGKTRGRIKNLENQRTLYDTIALALAIYPMITVYFTLLTAPATLFVSVRHWNSPQSIVRRTKIRFIVAMVLAVAQITGWVLIVFMFATRHRR